MAVEVKRGACGCAPLPIRLEWNATEVVVLSEGRRFRLGKQQFDVLWCLVEARGRCLSIEHLARLVFGPLALPEAWDVQIRVLVNQLRRALVGSGATVAVAPGCGYAVVVGESRRRRVP